MKKIVILSVGLLCSCAYFNTFYNAQNYYRQGMKLVVNDTLKVDSEFFDKTIEKATAVIVKYPDSRYVDDALFMMGASYYYKGDYSRALEKLDFLCLNYPGFKFYDDALYYKGLAYYKQRKYGPAIIALQEAAGSKHYRIKAMIALSYVYFQQKDYASLAETIQKLLKERLDTKEKRWLLQLMGDAQYAQKLYPDALATFNELLSLVRLPEEQKKLKLKIAEIYLQMGEFSRCKDFLEGEHNPEFRSILGDLYTKLGNIKEAKEIYLEVAISTLNPDFAAQAFYKLAELYRNEDSLETAIAYYDSSMNRSVTGTYGVKAKKMVDILRRLNTLTSETEKPDRSQFLLAEIYFVDLGEPEKAVVEYEKVYTDFPESKWAPKALYAHFWIARNIFKNDSLADLTASRILSRYPGSTYAFSVKKVLEKKNGEELDE